MYLAGFGNRDSDKIAYKSVGVEPGKIFIVNQRGHCYREPNNQSQLLVNPRIEGFGIPRYNIAKETEAVDTLSIQ